MKKQLVTIRMAQTSDYSKCLPLFRTLYHGDIGPDFKQTFEDFVNSEDGVIMLAERSSKVIGVLVGSHHLDIDWEGRITKIDALIVEEAYRKEGIGKKLVQHLVTIARRKQCKAIKSRINRKNIVAQEFHKSLGFTEADTYEYFLDFE